MASQSEVQSSHNSSETTNVTVHSYDDLTDGQLLCLKWACEQILDKNSFAHHLFHLSSMSVIFLVNNSPICIDYINEIQIKIK